jgi:hypothetical protein
MTTDQIETKEAKAVEAPAKKAAPNKASAPKTAAKKASAPKKAPSPEPAVKGPVKVKEHHVLSTTRLPHNSTRRPDLADPNFSEIANLQGVSRTAIFTRVSRGWTRQEILNGKRDLPQKGKRTYTNTRHAERLGGFSAAHVARINGLSVPGLYYRIDRDLPFVLPPVTESKDA